MLVPCSLVLIGVILVSVAVSDRAEELLGHKDDQRIVIDEWAGYLVSIAFLPQTPRVLLLGIVLFRIIDVSKPLGISRLGNIKGGWGVVVDDLAGGVVVNILLRFLPH
jgi:phosphatidylglycerophosphatase A